MNAIRPAALVAATAALSFALVACSSGGNETPPTPQVSQEEPASTPDAEEAEYLDASSFVDAMKAALEGGTSYHTVMTIDLAEAQTTSEGDVTADGDSIAMSMSTSIDNIGTTHMILVDGTMYMNMGELTQDKYIALDLDDESNPLGENMSALTGQAAPSAMVEAMEDAIVNIEPVGEPVQLDGVTAQEYAVTIATDKATGPLGEAFAQTGAELPDELTYSYFIGPDDLVRKISYELAGSKAELLYTDWGQDVEIVAPAPEDIIESPL